MKIQMSELVKPGTELHIEVRDGQVCICTDWKKDGEADVILRLAMSDNLPKQMSRAENLILESGCYVV